MILNINDEQIKMMESGKMFAAFSIGRSPEVTLVRELMLSSSFISLNTMKSRN